MIRSTKSVRAGLALAGVAALALSACGTTGGDKDDDSSASGDCTATIAFLGPTTGPNANLGINIAGGAKVALDEFKNADPKCDVTLKEFDSQGDPEKATPLATQIINDSSILGVVGPTFSGESDATGPAFNEAGLVTVSASATNPALTTHGWKTFHRILGTDADQAPGVAKYITGTVDAKKVMVVDDASEYGKGLADGVKQELGSLVTATDTVQQQQTDFSATVTKAKASGTDVLFYGGYYAEAGLLAKQLKQGGYSGIFMSGDGTLDPGFVKGAGAEAANGAVLTCPCAPSPDDFATKYKELNGQDPGTYSAEGYDAMNVFLKGLDEGNDSREKMLDWVQNFDGEGITKHIKFDENGDISDVVIYAYKVENGEIQPGVPIE